MIDFWQYTNAETSLEVGCQTFCQQACLIGVPKLLSLDRQSRKVNLKEESSLNNSLVNILKHYSDYVLCAVLKTLFKV